MKRILNWNVVLMAMCVVGGAFTTTYAQESVEKSDRKAFGEKMEFRIQAIYDQLALSEDQKKLLEENKSKHKAVKEQLRATMTANMDSFGEELKKEDYDLKEITRLHEESKNLRNQMADDRLQGILEVRKILTQEQFIKFTQLMQEQKEKRQF